MHSICRTVLIAAAVLTGPVAAHATTVDFNTLSGSNGTAFTSYTENGFKVANSAGQFYDAISGAGFIGDPKPSIYTADGSVTVTAVGGGNFDLVGLDMANFDAPPRGTYTIAGFLGATNVFTDSGFIRNTSADEGFETYATSFTGDTIDRLVIHIDSENTSNLDNIELSAVSAPTPEPSSFMLLGSGLLSLGAVARRRLSA